MDNFETDMKKEVPAVRIKRYWDTHPFFAFFVVFTVFFLLFSSIYLFTPGISSFDDHFFHIKYAYLLRTQGWDAVNNFHWIYLSNVSAENAPYQFSLFQIALIPFTFIKDLVLALKISDIFWASLCLALLYHTFRKMRIKIPFFFVFLLMISGFFVGKILIGRALVMVVAFIFLEIYLAIEKKYVAFFFLSLLHILWHQASFFWPPAIALIVETARYLETEKCYWKNFAIAISAFFLSFAFLFNFPINIWLNIKGMATMLFLSSQGLALGEGSELYAVDPGSLLGNSELFLFFSLIGNAIVIFYYLKKKEFISDQEREGDSKTNILMYSIFIFLALCLFGSIVISGRLFDFYFPASVCLFAIIITRLINEDRVKVSRGVSWFVFLAVIIFVIFLAGSSLIDQKKNIYNNDYEPYRHVSQWIDEKSQTGDKVFLHNWSWFTMAFFFNSNNYYSMGIEPMTLKDYKPDLYWKWSNIFQYNIYCEKEKYCAEEGMALAGKLENSSEKEKNEILRDNGRKMIESIKNDFGSKFIVSDSPRFNNAVSLNDDLIEDSYEAKSKINGSSIMSYKLK